jgi:hypothetical protein
MRPFEIKLVIGAAVAIATTDRDVFFGNDGEDSQTGHGINAMGLGDMEQCGCSLYGCCLRTSSLVFYCTETH